MNKDEAQELIDKKDFTKYSFEYLDGYVDAMNIMESRVCGNCKYWHSKKIDHPNWRECNHKLSPYLYADTIYTFYCNYWKKNAN